MLVTNYVIRLERGLWIFRQQPKAVSVWCCQCVSSRLCVCHDWEQTPKFIFIGLSETLKEQTGTHSSEHMHRYVHTVDLFLFSVLVCGMHKHCQCFQCHVAILYMHTVYNILNRISMFCLYRFIFKQDSRITPTRINPETHCDDNSGLSTWLYLKLIRSQATGHTCDRFLFLYE